MNIRCIAQCITIVSLFTVSPALSAQIDFLNRTESPLTLWLWGARQNAWVDQIHLSPSQRAAYSFDDETQFYIVARTAAGKRSDAILGWYDFQDLSQRPDFDAIAIHPSLIKEEKTSTYTICKPVWETRIRSYIAYRYVIIDGCWQLMPMRVEETYKVCKMVPEQRTLTTVVTRPTVIGGAWGAEERLKSTVTFSTTPTDAEVHMRLLVRKGDDKLPSNTNTTQDIAVGDYFIWTVRKGKVTSAQVRQPIFKKQLNIELSENGTSP